MIKDKVFDTDKLTEIETPLFIGVCDIDVELVHYIENPYRGMVSMALATWGGKLDKWPDLTPKERFSVVSKILKRKALPLGLEAPIFLFGITGVTRSSFDQIARQRIGSTFASLGWNNVHTRTGFRIPNEIMDNDEKWQWEILNYVDAGKDLYAKMIEQGISWQSAREVLPMGMLHWFYFSVTYAALQQFCSRRLCFSEKEDTVATAWLMRERVKDKFPYLASCLRPACDWSKKCAYHPGGSLPEEMGSLFLPCGRNECIVDIEGVDFDRPSTDVNDLNRQLGFKIPESNEDLPAEIFEELDDKDRVLFNDN